MDNTYTLVSFNCKNVKRSIDGVRELCLTADIIALQETWLLPHDLPYLSGISEDFAYTGTSAVDVELGLLRGRPYGGTALMWRKSAFQAVSVIQCNNPRISCIKIECQNKSLLIFCVYMPTDKTINLVEFTECLSVIHAILNRN